MADRERVRKKDNEESIQKRKRAHDAPTGDSKACHAADDSQNAGPVSARSGADLAGKLHRSRGVDAGQMADILTDLQRSRGNAYVQRLLRSRNVQAKMTVNPPDDVYEKEADQVAEAVTRKGASGLQRQAEEEEEVQTKRAGVTLIAGLQRQAEEEEEEPVQAKAAGRMPMTGLQRQAEEEEEEPVQTKRAGGTPMTGLQRQAEEEEEEPVQTSASGSRTPEVSDATEARISAARGSGQPLPGSVLGSFEPQFGRDFSGVRVHMDAEADSLSRQLGARAFTTGQDIFFRSGDYQPESEEGRRLLGHEMTHVVQQGGADISRQPAETAEKAKTEPKAAAAAETKDDAAAKLLGFVEKIRTGLERRYIAGLLRWSAACQLLGEETMARNAMDEAAELAMAVLQRKMATFDVRLAKGDMVAALLRASADAQMLGGDDKATEAAIRKVTTWYENQLAGAMKRLKEAPTEANVREVLRYSATVGFLGGDEKWTESAIRAALAWAQDQLAAAMKMLRAAPTEAAAHEVVRCADAVTHLGGDATDAYEAARLVMLDLAKESAREGEPAKAK